jgi:hypothetical protein
MLAACRAHCHGCLLFHGDIERLTYSRPATQGPGVYQYENDWFMGYTASLYRRTGIHVVCCNQEVHLLLFQDVCRVGSLFNRGKPLYGTIDVSQVWLSLQGNIYCYTPIEPSNPC